jgi:hypothetical protein
LIPIYTKDENSKNTNRFKIPRPKGQRTESTTDVVIFQNSIKIIILIILLVLWALLDLSHFLDSI